ncbi:hypothetical protein [Cutibacterium acnes]|uniref:hypothetical protein n=1 Tax=Cutibacterium acnes TaxID=1747 RepID=UPI001F357C90|nr:hypothetical protein [Cutibacterium acnes]
MYGLTAAAQKIADNRDAITRFVLVARDGQMMARTAMIEPLLSSFPRVTIRVPCWKSCNISLSGKLICRELRSVLRRTASVGTASLSMPSATSRTRG